MDAVTETPLKRRKTAAGHVNTGQGYNSQDDSGDDLFMDLDETVATIPLPKHIASNSAIASYPMPYETQPTQLLGDNAPIPCSPPRPTVQVAASSPDPISPQAIHRPKTSLLAQTMAPPGTQFRAPAGVSAPVKKVPAYVELSDDEGMQYVGGSSDEDTKNGPKDTQVSSSSKVFEKIMAKSIYTGPPVYDQRAQSLRGSVFDPRNRDSDSTVSRISVPKRGADTLANAYGSVSRPPKQARLQSGPSRARPVTDMALKDIEDYGQRQKVKRIQLIMSKHSIRDCYNALVAKVGNEDDALNYLAEKDEQEQAAIDLTRSDNETDELSSLPKKISAKQQLKAPVKSIKEKFSKLSQAPPAKSPLKEPKPSTPPAKPKRKLVRGRRAPSSPPPASSSPIAAPKRAETPISIDDDTDSGLAQSESDDGADFNGSLINFFNTCSPDDLIDIASISKDLAKLVVEKKPFKSLRQVRAIVDTNAPVKNTKTKSTKRPIGERIVDVCESMWTGYRAIDELVNTCKSISKPVADEMKKWGVDVFGASNSGELEMVSLGDDKSDGSIRDSGIGTPTSTTLSADEDADIVAKKTKSKSSIFPQPAMLGEGVLLKDYQVVGINWLSLLFKNKLSCILADDMGLGKTCQVVSFLAHLYEKGEQGPHVIVVPSSTLENWLREFRKFCPQLHAEPYYGSQKEREEAQDILTNNPPNVVITTYTIAKKPNDRKFLRRLRPTVCVYDEGHALKNRNSAAYEELMKIKCQFRLLLTGTPLQNNLTELASLLGFILPDVFEGHKEELKAIFDRRAKTEDDSSHEGLLSAQRIARARSMMAPFILRRKKHQVLKHLPAKTKRVEYCDMTDWQKVVYKKEWDRKKAMVTGRANGDEVEKNYNSLMALRKAAIHPALLRHAYSDEKCKEMTKAYMTGDREVNEDLVLEDLQLQSDFTMIKQCEMYPKLYPYKLPGEPWMDSAKVEKLVSLLLDYKANGDRVLIFSQMTTVMDILEQVLNTVNVKFCRLDGNTEISARQELIDLFYEDTTTTAFMLSTKAGGAGINLACANKVVIFDTSFNPQDDIQAENRAHRVGQTREVEVVRLITKGTVEEAIHSLGETKLALDDRVAGAAANEGVDEVAAKKVAEAGAKAVEKMLEEQMKNE